ncbi:alpha/beta fold hydrolase [Ornithinimicrobium murale]|uniref:alpha/beta fold hydrolase n=1 Tax=Ornithinimicrobium murale TaxID=1050153 RepID=UPI0013B4018F|nr:alpha/beta hydrolase [Ornithinimicrobium murale]
MSDAAIPPRLVLVHGTRMDASVWQAYPALLPDAELVPVDLPGHGSRHTEEFSADSALETIRAAVDGRSPGQRVVLAGHSLGGYLAMLYADRHPSALDALVLVGASAEPVGPLAGVYRRFADLLPRVGAERMARASNAVMRRLGAGDQALPGAEGYAALPAAWEMVFEECRASLLEKVECPVFLVNGQFDQMRVHVRRYVEAGHDTRVTTVPRATHLLPMTHPEQLAEVLREALSDTGRQRWQVDFWLDPSCPLTRHTARWLALVDRQVPLEIRWHVMSLAVLNEHRAEDPEGDSEGYLWIPARIAAAVQTTHGSAALGAFYDALWTTPEGRERSSEDTDQEVAEQAGQTEQEATGHDWLAAFHDALERCGLPGSLAEAGTSAEHDEALRASHLAGVGLVDAEVGTPILRLTAPSGTQRAFFGPVLEAVPDEQEALAIWHGLVSLVSAPTFRELKS